MRSFLVLALLLAPASNSFAANLSYSNYLKDGLTPVAIASDAGGAIYLAGSLLVNLATRATTAVVIKLDPNANVTYFTYLDAMGSDNVSAIAADAIGDAYIAGSTNNPNFPTTASPFGTPPASATVPRAFLVKLDPSGAVVFSVLLGGTVATEAQAIALTPGGQIILSGTCLSSNFPVTPGAYSVADSSDQPFLMELDPTATSVVFAATGIGGSSLALDSAGNIYISGGTFSLDYPTTPGSYQPVFTPSYVCYGLCQIGFPGQQQYLTKVDPSGSRLIYSTGINGVGAYRSGSVLNGGLAVDAAGNAYVSGVVQGGQYPFIPTPPPQSGYEYGFVSKIDPAGASLLWSVPGGGDVALDSSGAVYAAGFVTAYNSTAIPLIGPVAPPAALSAVPSQCLPNNVTANSEAYAIKLDPATGAALDAQWIDGSALSRGRVALAGGKLWIAGATQFPDMPFTPGAVPPRALVPGMLPGTYLSAVDFSLPAGGPQINCVLDGGNLSHVGALGPDQLLTIFGGGLGPDGVSVTFDGAPAQLLYASATQINVVTPAAIARQSATVMQVSVNGVLGPPRQFPVVPSDPNLFVQPFGSPAQCAGSNTITPFALNADGSANSCSSPAKTNSILSLFAHGRGAGACLCYTVTLASGPAQVLAAAAVNNYLDRIDIILPPSISGSNSYSGTLGEFFLSVELNGAPVGPPRLPSNNALSGAASLIVWVTPAQ